MIEARYRHQVDLLIDVLPYINREKCFALKGGTAINLFIRDLPRLSVDIDLTYLPFDDRAIALQNIALALKRVKATVESAIPDVTVNEVADNNGFIAKLTVQKGTAQIKIEVNTILRGHLFEAKSLQLSLSVQRDFGKFAEIKVASKAELFGGKICAALDRQHPRDLFDVHYLLENEGFTEQIKYGFLSALLCHGRPVHEVLAPNFKDQHETFKNNFEGMTYADFSYSDFENTRIRLVEEVQASLTETDKEFLITFTDGNPQWDLYPHDRLKDLPGVQWKLLNIGALLRSDPDRNLIMRDELIQILYGS